jgi:polyphosphate:AMP phosphotransferase
MLSNERVLVIKIWLHLSKRDQRSRFKELSADPKTAWRVTKLDWEHFEIYDRFRKQSERALRATSTGAAPWHVIESTDEEYRALSVGQIIHDAIRKRIDDPVLNSQIHAPALLEAIDNRTLLGSLDLSKTLDKESYESRLADLQARLNKVSRRRSFQKRNVVLVFEGADAAGKGGAIRRITAALDARQYRVTPIAAPTDEERARPYLWRFWRNLPRKGHFGIFDRSWYGRVLVERIEKFCDEDDWMRAYGEINDFEEGLAEAGAIIVKFWLHISPEEQLKRFTERQETAFKRFKIGPEDWRNREKADAYRVAGSEMIDRTSTEFAPWTIVEANDKRYARIKVLRTLVERLESELSDS